MKNKQLSLILFLIVQLYIYIMHISFNNLVNTKILSITSTILCVLIGLFMFCKTKDYFIMISALFITLLADIFFVLFNNLQVLGLMSLNMVQILYFLRTYIASSKKRTDIITRIIIIPISVLATFLILKNRIDISSILWVIYFVNLFLNILFTIDDIGINNFFPIGLLFLFIHASLMMFLSLENYTIVNIPLVNFLSELPFDVKAMFYLPAQVILTCSIFTVNRRSFSKLNNIDQKKDSDNL